MRSAGDRLSADPLLGENPGLEKRLDQCQDALVPDSTSYAAHQGRMVDLVEARLDVCLEYPVVIPVG